MLKRAPCMVAVTVAAATMAGGITITTILIIMEEVTTMVMAAATMAGADADNRTGRPCIQRGLFSIAGFA